MNRPKRRKYKDNPYSLLHDEENDKYFVLFKNNKHENYKVEVTKSIFEIFDRFELDDLSELNEYDNHIEHSKIYEKTISKRIFNKPLTTDMIVEKKVLYDNLSKEIKMLPKIQQRRLIKYYFRNQTFESIAYEEKCTKRAVKFSVDIAIKKLSKKFKNWTTQI